MSTSTDYDAIVVGTGAGGATAAGTLALAGRRVLVLERGRPFPYASERRDHLRNHRVALHGHNTGPSLDGNPRVLVTAGGKQVTPRPHEGGWNNNAMALGGGTVVYGGQAWRFMPQDFRMATEYGVPAGSSLADWPIGYDDLTPFYERIEHEVGVCGDARLDGGSGIHRDKPLPMPPMPMHPAARLLTDAADRLGWPTAPVPLLINSIPYNGRPACVGCGECPGFACPTDAKNGGFNTLLTRGLATGNCTLVTGARVTRIDTNDRGDVIGVIYVDAQHAEHSPKARHVVVACGAIESARLLLISRTRQHPAGLGNANDQVGRNLQGHHYVGAIGVMAEPVQPGGGPGPRVSTCRWNHGNPGIIGGGMLADDFVKLPIAFWQKPRPPGVPSWGLANKRYMRHAYPRTIEVVGPVHEIPSPDCRVTLDPAVRDSLGLPVARLGGTTHPATLDSARFMQEKAMQWIAETGARHVRPVGDATTLRLSAGQHQAGTCRMGDDPTTSVCDRFGRVHGHANLWILDGSLHVTNGGFNPALTIHALALRGAEAITDFS